MDDQYGSQPERKHAAFGNNNRVELNTSATDSVARHINSDPVGERHTLGNRALHEINFTFLLRMALRHWRIMLLFGILGILGGIVYLQAARPIYSAEAEFEMNVRRPKMINTEAVFEDTGSGRDTDTIFNTRFAKFRSPAMERLATEEFFRRYPESKSADNEPGASRYTMAIFIRDVEWSKDPDANIVWVSYASPYPRFAANLVNVLSDCAGQLMMQENQALSDEAVKWLVSQVEEKREELEAVEGQLAEIRKDTQIDALEQHKTALTQVMVATAREREDLISRLTTRKTVYDYVAGLRNIDPNLEILPTGLPKEDELNELVRQWRIAHDEFQQTAGRYTEQHPAYRLAFEKEARATQRLEQFIEFSATAIYNEIKLLEKQIEQVGQRIDSMKSDALDLEQRLTMGMQRVQRVERQRDAADNSYQTMLRRIEEARISADDNMAFTTVIRKAEIPYLPIRPRKPLVMVFSCFMAGLAGLVTVGVMGLCMDKVGSVNDLRLLNLNILGVVPSQKRMDSRGEMATIGLRDKYSPIVELFSGINALLSSENYRDHTKVLLVSSVMPGEGKTVTSCNLAVSSAINGARTLLIEGDFRRPQLDKIFAVPDEYPSFLQWLSSGRQIDGNVDQLVCKDVIENLDLIISRPMKDIHPSEVLGRGGLPVLLDWARNHYDRIIIDTPPLGAVGDAYAWGNHSDSLILVSRVGKTRQGALRFALTHLVDTGIPVIGCIANDVSNSLEGMFNGGYGYGSLYGYSNYDKSDRG